MTRPAMVRSALEYSTDQADISLMDLKQCPYDATPVEFASAGSEAIIIRCPHCGARWEWHNAHIRRIDEPDVEAVRRRRPSSGPDKTQSSDDTREASAQPDEASHDPESSDDSRQVGGRSEAATREREVSDRAPVRWLRAHVRR